MIENYPGSTNLYSIDEDLARELESDITIEEISSVVK
jgi:hypothetical protein